MINIVPKPALQELEKDISLEQANRIFWASLIGHIKSEIRVAPENILDLGCHHGGLLEQLATEFRPQSLTGIEPSAHCRERALFRLRKLALKVSILPPERWSEVPASSINLLTCHEVLHLVEDLPELFHQISRTLQKRGTVFVVAGCHTENPLWRQWSAQLQDQGQTIYNRTPFDILRAADNAGLSGAIRPLRRDGWVIYNPDQATFKYSSVEELFDHQYRHKLLFRFIKE